MQISHRLRRLAAALLLVPLSAAIQPVAAAELTQTANVVKVASLTSSDTTVTDWVSSIRGDMLLANDGNLYLPGSGGGKGFGGIGVLKFDAEHPKGVVSTLYSFADGTEGLSVFGGLIQGTDGALYGTSYFGGTNSTGTVFKLTLAGAFTKLHEFGDSGKKKEAKFPYTGVTQAGDGYLYGTTRLGGEDNRGAIYRLKADGTDFSIVHSFSGSDGQEPQGRLLLAPDGALYGTTALGGSNSRGVIYRISTSGEYDRLYSFPALKNFDEFGAAVNSAGANPRAGLIYVANGSGGGDFYGTAYQGGAHGFGTLYRATVSGDSADVTVLHAFAGWPLDGAFPLSAPVRGPDGNFYGTTLQGGYNVIGAAWKVAPDGTSEMLHSAFAGGDDGSQLYAGLLFGSDGTLYGISNTDDVGGKGIIFKLEQAGTGTLPVELSISAHEVTVNTKATITWSTRSDLNFTKCDKFGSWEEPTAEDDPLHNTPTAGSMQVDPAIGLYTYALACTDGAGVVHNAYVALLVTAPPQETVDGGQIVGGGGSLSLLLLALLAVLLVRKLIKETRSSCP